MTDFYQRVYEVVRLIPEGRVSSYGMIAKYLGSGRSARVVGYAMNGSHNFDPAIPAHRVVNRLGMLSGKAHFDTPDLMESLLKSEGLEIVDNEIVNVAEHWWDPQIELK